MFTWSIAVLDGNPFPTPRETERLRVILDMPRETLTLDKIKAKCREHDLTTGAATALRLNYLREIYPMNWRNDWSLRLAGIKFPKKMRGLDFREFLPVP